jgi:hypothetical protein
VLVRMFGDAGSYKLKKSTQPLSTGRIFLEIK